jgi:hypothetical protein
LMTWTGNNGDPSWFDYKYTVVGSLLMVTIGLDAGDIGGTPNIQCQLKIPRGYTAAGTAGGWLFIKDNGTRAQGRLLVSTGATNINLSKFDGSNFAAQTDTLQFFGQIFFPIN